MKVGDAKLRLQLQNGCSGLGSPLSPSHHCSQWGGRYCIRGGATISTATRSYRMEGVGPEGLPVNPLDSKARVGHSYMFTVCFQNCKLC